MNNKKNVFILVLTLILYFVNANELLVIGTIHHNHENNVHYSYQDVLNILHTDDPDVICVEIP